MSDIGVRRVVGKLWLLGCLALATVGCGEATSDGTKEPGTGSLALYEAGCKTSAECDDGACIAAGSGTYCAPLCDDASAGCPSGRTGQCKATGEQTVACVPECAQAGDACPGELECVAGTGGFACAPRVACAPACDGRGCGTDGCGGSCGTCGAGTSCNEAGQCVGGCTAECTGKQCGSDDCGGAAAHARRGRAATKPASAWAAAPQSAPANSAGPTTAAELRHLRGGDELQRSRPVRERLHRRVCRQAVRVRRLRRGLRHMRGRDELQQGRPVRERLHRRVLRQAVRVRRLRRGCGTCGAGTSCDEAGQCVSGCTAECSGKQCGSDGCGGSCGACGAGTSCNRPASA
ncbi:MAG: hypothetical protein R3F39_14415 [Myxococcota bacterium]